MIDGRHSREEGWRIGHASPAFALATTALFACSAAPNALNDASNNAPSDAQKEEDVDAAYLGALAWVALCATTDDLADRAALSDPPDSCRSRLDRAEQRARQALAARPDLRDAANALGVILVHRGRYDEAVDVLRPLANDIHYASPEEAWANLGWAYLLRGNIDEALDALRRSVAAQPNFCVGQYRLGLVYEKKGELGLAREALTKALETKPAKPAKQAKQAKQTDCPRLQGAFEARARVAMKLGLNDDARTDLERCREVAATTRVGQRCAGQLRSLQSLQ